MQIGAFLGELRSGLAKNPNGAEGKKENVSFTSPNFW